MSLLTACGAAGGSPSSPQPTEKADTPEAAQKADSPKPTEKADKPKPKAKADSLQEFQGEGFSAALPGKAERTEKTVGKITTVTYETSNATGSSGIIYYEMPAETPLSLDAITDISAKSVRGTVSSRTTTNLAGHEARDLEFTDVRAGGKTGTASMTVAKVNDRFYTILTMGEGADRPLSETHKQIRESIRFS